MPRAISHPTNRQSSASSGNSLRILPPTGRHALPGTASTRAIRPDRQPIVIDDSSESEPSSDDEAPPPASKASTSLAPPARPAKPISLDRNTRSRKSTASSSSATTTTTSSSSSGLKRTRSPVVDLTAEESPEHAAHASPRASHHSSQSKGKSKAFEPVPGANSNKRMRTTASPTLPDFEDDLTCAICYEIFMGPVNLSCGHVFCASCLTEWLEKTKDCPTCREPTAAEPGRALVIESIAEKFYQGQAARLENKGDPAGATAMRDQRAKRSQCALLYMRNKLLFGLIDCWDVGSSKQLASPRPKSRTSSEQSKQHGMQQRCAPINIALLLLDDV